MFYVIDFVVASIDKAINNVSFVSKRIYATALLKEFGVIGTPSKTYELVSDYSENILIQQIMKSNIFSKSIPENMNTILDTKNAPKTNQFQIYNYKQIMCH